MLNAIFLCDSKSMQSLNFHEETVTITLDGLQEGHRKRRLLLGFEFG